MTKNFSRILQTPPKYVKISPRIISVTPFLRNMVNMQDIFYLSEDGKTQIHAIIWRPLGVPRGVVQIVHGMSEYAGRYAPFADFLAENGYMVCAEDHLGHGGSVVDTGNLGWFNAEHDYKTVLGDIRALHLAVKKEAEGLPYFMVGHSMGSFFCRCYIALYGSELNGAVVMGTGFKGRGLLNLALTLTRLNAAFFGWKHKSKFLDKLAFGAYNKRFRDDNDPNAWLSEDFANVKAYNADDLCGFKFTDDGFYVLFSVIKAACAGKTINAVPKNLPILLVAGKDDPVGGYGKDVCKAYEKFKSAGVVNSEIKLYDGRHEILNDFCREEVKADILAFLNKNLIRI